MCIKDDFMKMYQKLVNGQLFWVLLGNISRDIWKDNTHGLLGNTILMKQATHRSTLRTFEHSQRYGYYKCSTVQLGSTPFGCHTLYVGLK